MWQGVKRGATKGKPVEEESGSEEEEEESESEEGDEEEDFIPLGNKRHQQSNDESFSKKQKFDNTTGKIINTEWPQWSHVWYVTGGKAAVTLFVGNLSYDVDTDTLEEFFTSQGLKPTSVRILEDSEGSSRG